MEGEKSRGRNKNKDKWEPLITWYPSRPLSLSSGTSSVKRLLCGGLVRAADGGPLGGAAADGGNGAGGRVWKNIELN